MSNRIRRRLQPLAIFALCLSSQLSSQEPSFYERLDDVDWVGWKDLSELLSGVHEQAGVPALGAALVRDGVVLEQATVGVHSAGSTRRVDSSASFHLGSVTKSFTAALIGRLVEEGELSWTTSVADVLTDVEMLAAYRSVTVEQLLQHRSGLPAYTDGWPAGHAAGTAYSGSPTKQRAEFLADVLMQEPVGLPGETATYSNAGYALAGYMAERVTGLSWEALMQRSVFDPLRMTSAGFGFPESPQGHSGVGPDFWPVAPDGYPPMDVIAPAGNIHCSVSDLAKYAAAHMDGLAGVDGFLKSATVQRLHTAQGADGFASGWRIGRHTDGTPLHHHAGTVGASFAEVRLYPASRTALMVVATVNRGAAEPIVNQVAKALLRRHAPREPAGFTRTKGEQTATDIPVTLGESTSKEDAHLWKVVQKMSEAINDEDRKAYRALFTSPYDLRDADSIFDFMARQILPKRGGVRSFHQLSPPMTMPGSPRTMRMVKFHLENGYPGYFGFSFDDAGAIAEFSLFIKGDVCPHGADRNCPEVVRTLGEDFE